MQAESFLQQNLGKVLITGGSGGLAHQILLLLVSRNICSAIHSLDIRSPRDPITNVQYHNIDLTSSDSIRALFADVRPDVVIHCASPRFDAGHDIMLKINVEGTRLLVDVARASGVKAFVYTSSASVVSDAKTDLRGADESYPLVMGEEQPEFYTHTKAVAESYVLSQNSPGQGFLTCAIRPSGIFGRGDSWVIPGMLEAYHRGQTKVQIGDNHNLFDFTESTNVAHGHHLAAAALIKAASQPQQSIPEANRVDGEAFFITNDEPVPFWDFTRMVWKVAGDQTRPEQIWVLSRTLALVIASLLEWTYWIARLGDPPLTMQKVRLSCMTRYYSNSKAKALLGYRPLIGLREGLERGVRDCLAQQAAEK